jgi:hypothetical protein
MHRLVVPQHYMLEKRPQKMGEGAKMYYTEITRREDLEVLLVQLERYSDVKHDADGITTPTTVNMLIPANETYLILSNEGIGFYTGFSSGFKKLTATQFLNKAKEMFPKTELAKDGFCGEEEDECCGNCRFWGWIGIGNITSMGDCRVEAAGPYEKAADDWCGQWKEKR